MIFSNDNFIKKGYKKGFLAVSFILLSAVLGACSVKNNTAFNRFYHNFTTRYNVYYNGLKSYEEAYDKFFEDLDEDYTHFLPIDPVAYSIDKGERLSLFTTSEVKAEKAIQEHSLRVKPKKKRGWKKDPELLAFYKKKEYNTFLENVWFLLGKSQYYNAEPYKALSTFSYISNLYRNNLSLYIESKLWEVRILILLNRLVEAEEILKSLNLKSNDNWAEKSEVYAYTLAMLYSKQEKYKQAIPFLLQAVEQTKQKTQKARLYYLLGQLAEIDSLKGSMPKTSRDYYNEAQSLTSSFALEFSAKLKQIQLSPLSSKSQVDKLKPMLKKHRYRSFYDKICYVIAQNYLVMRDSILATKYFELGVDSSMNKTYDYMLNLSSLEGIYLKQENWLSAQRVISLLSKKIPKTSSDYQKYRYLSRGLDSLYPYALEHHQKDSLLALVKMPESERLKHIDSVINALKEQELKAEKDQYIDAMGGQLPQNNQNMRTQEAFSSNEKGNTYFYNQDLLTRGRKDFVLKWGRRQLEDFWFLRRKPNLSSFGNDSLSLKIPADSLNAKSEEPDVKQSLLKAQDPHERAFYLTKLPFSLEAKKQIYKEIAESQLNEARVLRDELSFLHSSYRIYKIFLKNNPSSPRKEQVLFDLYLLALRLDKKIDAEQYRLGYLRSFPKGLYAHALKNKDYLKKLRGQDEQLEQLYRRTFDSYMQANANDVEQSFQKVQSASSKSSLYPRFVFLSAMAKVINGEQEAFVKRLQLLDSISEESELKELAKSMLDSIAKGGRLVASNPHRFNTYSDESFDVVEDKNEKSYQFVQPKKDISLALLMPKNQMSESELIYFISLHNYVNYTQRDFAIRSLKSSKFTVLLIDQFANMEELDTYLSILNKDLTERSIPSIDYIPISKENRLELHSFVNYRNYIKVLTKLSDKKLQVFIDLARKSWECLNQNIKIKEGASLKKKQLIKTLELKKAKGTKLQTIPLSYEDLDLLPKKARK